MTKVTQDSSDTGNSPKGEKKDISKRSGARASRSLLDIRDRPPAWRGPDTAVRGAGLSSGWTEFPQPHAQSARCSYVRT